LQRFIWVEADGHLLTDFRQLHPCWQFEGQVLPPTGSQHDPLLLAAKS
jgi:hypothetical protein